MVISASGREWWQLRVDDDQIRARGHGGSLPEVDHEIDRVMTGAAIRGVLYGLAGGIPVAVAVPVLVVWILRTIGGQ